MWKRISGTCVALLIAVPLYAQCPGGSCPSQRQAPPSIDIGQLPGGGQQQGGYGPVTQEGHLLSVVRIIGVEAAGSVSYTSGMVRGTGTYVNYEGFYCVVTASHVVRGTQKLYVVFRGSGNVKTVQGAVLANDPTNDVAIIGLYQHPADGEEIAATVAYASDIVSIRGETLRNYGFGGDDTLCGGAGQIVGELRPTTGLPASWYTVSSYARLGDSGGPVFLASGKLAGVLWGRMTSGVAVVKTSYLHTQLRAAKSQVSVEDTQLVQPRPLPRNKQNSKPLVPVLPIKPPVLPWRDKIEREIDGIKKAPSAKPDNGPGGGPPPVVQAPPKVKVDVETKPVAPPVIDEERYKVDRQVALLIISGVVLLCVVIGVAVQWKKTYSIQ